MGNQHTDNGTSDEAGKADEVGDGGVSADSRLLAVAVALADEWPGQNSKLTRGAGRQQCSPTWR